MREAAELGEVFFRDGRALGGNHAGDTRGVAADGVQLPFNEHEGLFAFPDRPGTVEVEDGARFFEEFGFRRVDVLGLAGRVILRRDIKGPGGEGDDAALDVANRNNQPATEATTPAGGVGYAVGSKEEAGLRQGFLAVAFFKKSGDELGVVDGGEADAEVVGDGEVKATLLRPVVLNPFSMDGVF